MDSGRHQIIKPPVEPTHKKVLFVFLCNYETRLRFPTPLPSRTKRSRAYYKPFKFFPIGPTNRGNTIILRIWLSLAKVSLHFMTIWSGVVGTTRSLRSQNKCRNPANLREFLIRSYNLSFIIVPRKADDVEKVWNYEYLVWSSKWPHYSSFLYSSVYMLFHRMAKNILGLTSSDAQKVLPIGFAGTIHWTVEQLTTDFSAEFFHSFGGPGCWFTLYQSTELISQSHEFWPHSSDNLQTKLDSISSLVIALWMITLSRVQCQWVLSYVAPWVFCLLKRALITTRASEAFVNFRTENGFDGVHQQICVSGIGDYWACEEDCMV